MAATKNTVVDSECGAAGKGLEKRRQQRGARREQRGSSPAHVGRVASSPEAFASPNSALHTEERGANGQAFRSVLANGWPIADGGGGAKL